MSNEHDEKLRYDPKWKGPLHNRSCTDCFCVIIFLAFIGGWAGIGLYAYSHGDLSTVLVPTDSEGRRCGIDSDVVDRKNLVFFDPQKCLSILSVISGCDTPQVCVKKCPTEEFLWEIHSSDKNATTLSNMMICKIEVNLNNVTKEQLKRYIDDNMCARWYTDSEAIKGRCIPAVIPSSVLLNSTITAMKLFGDNTDFRKLFENIMKTLEEACDDLRLTSLTILAILCCSAIISLIYILFMRWLATPVVFISIIGVTGLLGYSTYCFYMLYHKYSSTFWLTLTIICGVLLGIFLLVCVFLRNRIRLACQLISEASKAVISITSTLSFPIVRLMLQIAVIAYALTIGLYVLTLRVPTHTMKLGVFDSNSTKDNSSCISDECYMTARIRPWYSTYMQAYNIVGLLWLSCFVSAFGEMVLAGTFATWYWTFRKSDVPFFTVTGSLWRTVRYHLGTLALGSFILTICHLIRLALEYVDRKLKKYDNELVSFLLKCMKCYFWLLEKFLKFINKNAYIMCSIHGKCFCMSARDAFNLLMRNILRVFVIDKITEWLLFMGKILVTGSVSWFAWWWIDNEFSKINYLVVPVIVVALGTYLIASVFFSVYSMAVDTLFLCFLEDSERNDGTLNKPYYMSKGLLRILRKS